MNRSAALSARALAAGISGLVALALGVAPAGAVVGGASLDSSDLSGGAFSSLALVRLAGGTCSGALVAADLVLTAAHCEAPVSVQVAGSEHAVVQVHVAPGFDADPTGSDHDLALLRLDGTVPAVPLSFATAGGEVDLGSPVTFAGFGTAGSPDAAAVGFGEVVGLRTRSFDVAGESSACEGDSGGPVLADGLIVGVVSAGQGGVGCFETTIATRVSAQVDFLASFVDVAPVAASDTTTIVPGGRANLTLRAQDTAGEELDFSIVEPGIFTPSKQCHGTDTGPDATVRCAITAPRDALVGTVSELVFMVSDGRDTSFGVVSVEVRRRGGGNAAPTAADASVEMGVDGVVTFALPADDPDGDALTSTIRNGPTSGNVYCEQLECTYYAVLGTTPGQTDSFTYTVSDGRRTSNEATVSITTVGDRAPVFANPDQAIVGFPGVAVLHTFVMLDAEADKVTVSAVDPVVTDGAGTVSVSCFDDHGAARQQRVECLVSASPGFSGDAAFSLQATDGTSVVTDELRVSVAPNRAPSIVPETFSIGADEDFRFPLLVLPHEADPDCNEAVLEYEGAVACDPLAYTIEIDDSLMSGEVTCDTDRASDFNGWCSFVPAASATGDQVLVLRWSVSDGAASSSTVTTKVTYRLP